MTSAGYAGVDTVAARSLAAVDSRGAEVLISLTLLLTTDPV